MRRAVAIGQMESGEVLIREAGGRILQFDPWGNFIAETQDSPIALLEQSLTLLYQSPDERSWTLEGSGDWAELDNWFYWNRPDTSSELAIFGSAITKDSRVELNRVWTVRGLRFRSEAAYLLAGRGGLNLKCNSGLASVEVQVGNHTIGVPLTLGSDAMMRVDKKTNLLIKKKLDLAGHLLRVNTGGEIRLGGPLVMHGGVLEVCGETPLYFDAHDGLILDGTLRFVADDESTSLAAGNSLHLIAAESGPMPAFAHVDLPELGDGLSWDMSAFRDEGVVRVSSD